MEVGFETIGNATVICHDKTPILATDPWLVGNAYFGSWKMSHQIPDEQMEAVKSCEYIWLSHGHPDHLSMESLKLLKDKKILLPDHVGGRIERDLTKMGFNVVVLKDRSWTQLSPRIHVWCVADYNQDAVLLMDVNGCLLVDTNDTQPRGWGPNVRKLVGKYKHSFLLQLFGYGEADMINFFDDDGVRVEPRAALKLPVGKTISDVADMFGTKYVIPFSSMHRYQRADSIWANEYVTPLEVYKVGFDSEKSELLPAYIRYDCETHVFDEINPPLSPEVILEPSEFGDDWSETLDEKDIDRVKGYFKKISHLSKVMDFINIKVGGEDNIVELSEKGFDKGIEFEVPRRSLTRAVRWEIFDDLLIGNFMKTHMVGDWPKSRLYPDFTPYVSKYSDNGLAVTEDDLRKYFREYRNRAPINYLRHRMQSQLASVGRTRLDSTGPLYRIAQRGWWFVNKRLGL